MVNNRTEQNSNTFLVEDMYRWRLTKAYAEKRAENVNRELLRRQHN